MIKLRALLTLAVLSLLIAAGCGSNKSNNSASSNSSTEGPTNASGCKTVPNPKPRPQPHLAAPTLKLNPKKTYIAHVMTSCGDFDITLDVQDQPKTTASFVYLVRKKFYDGLKFHRIAPAFVIQGGDPLGKGTGGPGYSITETPPNSIKYTSGIVAMAKAPQEPAGTSGSQFFVVTGEDIGLPPDYAVLGKVTKGMDVVNKIGVVKPKAGSPDIPSDIIVMRQITVSEN